MKLQYHPISSYSQKTLIAIREKNAPIELAIIDLFGDPAARAAYEKQYPLGRVPTLVLDNGEVLGESSTIVDYIDAKFSGGPQLIPAERDQQRMAHHYDRVFDLYVNNQFVVVFFDGLKPPADREPKRVATAIDTLDKIYAELDHELAGRTWATGANFTIADCSAAPALTYAKMVRPFDQHKNLNAYHGRLLARPSIASVIADAQPYLAQFVK